VAKTSLDPSRDKTQLSEYSANITNRPKYHKCPIRHTPAGYSTSLCFLESLNVLPIYYYYYYYYYYWGLG